MHCQRGSNRLFPWVPLGLVAALTAAVVTLFWMNHPSEAQAGSPKAIAGFQTKDKLLLTVNLPAVADGRTDGNLTVELLDDGQSVHKSSLTVKLSANGSSQRIEVPTPTGKADKLIVVCTLDKRTVQVPLSQILLVKAHETAVSSNQEFFAGSTAALRCSVHGVKSVTESIPLPHSTVQVGLKDKAGKVTPLYQGATADNGVAAARLELPTDLKPGNLQAPGGDHLHARRGKTRARRQGQDRPQDPPHLRQAPVPARPDHAPSRLSLQSHDLTPVGNTPLTFEVEDPKGNKVFKRTLQTSDHGIAAIDFTLASEVNNGDYQVRAQIGDVQSAKTVTVKPYVLPKFKSELKADKRFYLPKETLNGDLQVDYFFGKPVAGARVEIKASTFDVAFKEFQTWQGKTDERGHVKFEIKLPDYFVGQPLDKGNALLRLETKVTDSADHSEVINKTYPVSNQPVQISLIPGGRPVGARHGEPHLRRGHLSRRQPGPGRGYPLARTEAGGETPGHAQDQRGGPGRAQDHAEARDVPTWAKWGRARSRCWAATCRKCGARNNSWI